MDFAGGPVFLHKPTISVASAESIGLGLQGDANCGVAGTAVWPSANLGIYVPLKLSAPVNVKKVWWANGTAVAGNVDVGIYTVGGTRLASIGPTAQATTNVVQSATLGIRLEPGRYYMAMSESSGSSNFLRFNPFALRVAVPMGVATQASVGTLPATATFATFSVTFIPVFGITSAGVI